METTAQWLLGPVVSLAVACTTCTVNDAAKIAGGGSAGSSAVPPISSVEPPLMPSADFPQTPDIPGAGPRGATSVAATRRGIKVPTGPAPGTLSGGTSVQSDPLPSGETGSDPQESQTSAGGSTSQPDTAPHAEEGGQASQNSTAIAERAQASSPTSASAISGASLETQRATRTLEPFVELDSHWVSNPARDPDPLAKNDLVMVVRPGLHLDYQSNTMAVHATAFLGYANFVGAETPDTRQYSEWLGLANVGVKSNLQRVFTYELDASIRRTTALPDRTATRRLVYQDHLDYVQVAVDPPGTTLSFAADYRFRYQAFSPKGGSYLDRVQHSPGLRMALKATRHLRVSAEGGSTTTQYRPTQSTLLLVAHGNSHILPVKVAVSYQPTREIGAHIDGGVAYVSAQEVVGEQTFVAQAKLKYGWSKSVPTRIDLGAYKKVEATSGFTYVDVAGSNVGISVLPLGSWRGTGGSGSEWQPTGKTARTSIQTTLNRLRGFFPKHAIVSRDGRIFLDDKVAFVDVWALERLLDEYNRLKQHPSATPNRTHRLSVITREVQRVLSEEDLNRSSKSWRGARAQNVLGRVSQFYAERSNGGGRADPNTVGPLPSTASQPRRSPPDLCSAALHVGTSVAAAD
jgi:hypothetical protein